MALIYANARIKSLENDLLTTDKMMRMVDSSSLEDAVKVLIESNYGGGVVLDNPNKFDQLLSSELASVTEFIREIMPEGLGMEIFFIRNDYHNAKALMKAKYTGIDNPNYMLLSKGQIEIDKLSECIKNDEYRDLPEELRQALESIDNAFISSDRSPSLIDITIDKAYYKHIDKLSSSSVDSIRKYIKSMADMTNIATFVRCKRAGLNYKYFESSYVVGGELKEDFFEPLYELSDEIISDKFRYTSYFKIAAKAFENKERALVDYETEQDNYLLSLFKIDKHDMFSIAPMAGYYLAKITEIKVARMILVCIKNKVDKLLIKQRLRELYA